MISFHTQINGKDFEIEVDDGLKLELTDGKLTVKRVGNPSQSALPDVHYHYHYPSGVQQPYWNQPVQPLQPFISPTITYEMTTTVAGDHSENICLHNPQSITKN